VAWHFDSKGKFSVKSAYHVLADGGERKRTVQVGKSSSCAANAGAPPFAFGSYSLINVILIFQEIIFFYFDQLYVKEY
jgi:hypothetical protein